MVLISLYNLVMVVKKMSKKEEIIYASLLHDIGKLVMRATGEKIKHQKIGLKFIEEHFNKELLTTNIINGIQYHHKEDLERTNLNNDDISYIIYEADNISAALDRRENEETLAGFNLTSPLYSIFNILNNNNQELGYELKVFKKSNDIIKLEKVNHLNNDTGRYTIVMDELIISLNKMKKTMSPNTLLRLLELTTNFVPSSTNRKEQIDISLYNHLKTTAMIATNIYDYYHSLGINNFKNTLLKNKDEFRNTNVHLLLKADISGIQNFIYNIPNEEALKNLRARSFYLEMLTENIADELLETLKLSRCNLIYSGGGTFQMLIPNTTENKEKTKEFITAINNWMIKQYKEKLYIAINYVECSANDLANDMAITQKTINYFGEKHKELSQKSNYTKISRYSCEELLKLYNIKNLDSERECKICKTSSLKLNDNNKCPNCEALTNIGRKLNKFSETYIIITNNQINNTSITMFSPNNLTFMSIVSPKVVEELLENKKIIRLYTINQDTISLNYATDIMYGGNENNLTLEELSKLSIGDKLLGVLRIDVDQLSQAFINGFSRNNKTDFRFNTISRNTSLSNLLNIFFKSEVRKLAKKEFSFEPITLPIGDYNEYNINIVYSGGDDVFAVGPWNQVLEFAININKEFKLYTANTLTLSAGFSIFNPSTPILKLANEVGNLETVAKNNGRNSICLFTKDYVFKWEEFENNILTKINKFHEWFTNNINDKNKLHFSTSFYSLRLLINEAQKVKKISKIAYSLARIQEGCKNERICEDFTTQMLIWCRNKQDLKYLDIAMMLVIYLNREGGCKNDN